MADKIPQPRKPKFAAYRDRNTGEIYPALRTPAGYEDDHPKDYEGIDDVTPAPVAATDGVEVLPSNTLVSGEVPPAPVEPAPLAPAPLTPAPTTDNDQA